MERLARCAVLTALALALSMAERALPLTTLIPLPGLRLGLANLVTVFALCRLSGREALLILVARCLLGAIGGGSLTALAFSLTGCEELDYRDAVDLYNAGAYEAAVQKFAALGDFEDSAQLETRCYYWIAMKAMEYGRFDAALEQFLALGDYEDCPERVTECRYQLAVAAFDGGDLETAESYFLQSPDYKQTREYCRQITWQKFFDAIAEKAPGEAESVLSAEKDGHMIQVIARSADVQARPVTIPI